MTDEEKFNLQQQRNMQDFAISKARQKESNVGLGQQLSHMAQDFRLTLARLAEDNKDDLTSPEYLAEVKHLVKEFKQQLEDVAKGIEHGSGL